MYEARRQRSSWARIKLSIVRKVYIHSPYRYGYSDLIFVVLEIIRVLAKLLFASANFVAFRSAISLELTSSARYARFTLPKISSFAFELTSFSISFSQHCVFFILLSMCKCDQLLLNFSTQDSSVHLRLLFIISISVLFRLHSCDYFPSSLSLFDYCKPVVSSPNFLILSLQ